MAHRTVHTEAVLSRRVGDYTVGYRLFSEAGDGYSAEVKSGADIAYLRNFTRDPQEAGHLFALLTAYGVFPAHLHEVYPELAEIVRAEKKREYS